MISRWVVRVLAVCLLNGCDSAPTSPYGPAGTEGGECLPDSQCQIGLICASNLCVKSPRVDGGRPDIRTLADFSAAKRDAARDAAPDHRTPDQRPDGPTCGDGVVSGKEECDAPQLGGHTCVTEGFEGGTLKCKADCTLDKTGCFKCGDGILNGQEKCDGIQFGAETCKTQGFDSGSLKCKTDCTLDTTGCGRCGDTILNGSEECDGSQLGGKTCKTQGFIGGTVSCKAGCVLDVNNCKGVVDQQGIAVSTAPGPQNAPSVASNGTDFFIVWEDYRSGTSYDIYGSRVDAQGAVLDPAGIPISTGKEREGAPVVGFDGTNYFVVWEDQRSLGNQLYGARVTPSGVVLDGAGILLTAAKSAQVEPGLTCSGGKCLAIWADTRNSGRDIYAAFVSTSGTPQPSADFPVSLAAGDESFPAVAQGPGGYLAAWTDNRNKDFDLYAARITSQGTVLDQGGIAVSTAAGVQRPAKTSSDGTNYLVVWMNGTPSGPPTLCSRVSSAGLVLDAAGITIGPTTGQQWTPVASFDGSNYFVVWNNVLKGIDGTRLSPAGAVLDGTGFRISTHGWTPVVAYNGSVYLVVWKDDRNPTTDYDIYAARVRS